MLKRLLGIPDRRVDVQSIDELVDALIALEHRNLDLDQKTRRPQVKNTEDCIRRMIQMVTFRSTPLSEGRTSDQWDVFLPEFRKIKDELCVLLQDYIAKQKPNHGSVRYHVSVLLGRLGFSDPNWESDLKKMSFLQIRTFIFALIEVLQ